MHPCGIIYEVILKVEELALRLGVKGHCSLLLRRGLHMGPDMVIDFIRPDGSFFRVATRLKEEFLITPPTQWLDKVLTDMERVIREKCLDQDNPPLVQ